MLARGLHFYTVRIHVNRFAWRDMNNGTGIDTEIETMSTHVIQDWTKTEVPMKCGPARDVRYKVYKEGTRLFQEIRDFDNQPIHTLELPQGMTLERSSYEVLLRYVLVDVVNT
jgi:hypothetical protein